ncbi:MAG: SHOCT domain-containing protein [Caldilineaceae bacterium]|nr:SHOCT domain-containing protein [Caldilineaceae bacterium]
MLALWTLLVLLVLWGIRAFTETDDSSALQATGFRQTPLEILQARHARGEVSREEYETIRRDLNST